MITNGSTMMNMNMIMANRQVESKDPITTPAGTFDAYKITSDMNLENRVMGMPIRSTMRVVSYRADNQIIRHKIRNLQQKRETDGLFASHKSELSRSSVTRHEFTSTIFATLLQQSELRGSTFAQSIVFLCVLMKTDILSRKADYIGITGSVLCIIHCLITPVLLLTSSVFPEFSVPCWLPESGLCIYWG